MRKKFSKRTEITLSRKDCCTSNIAKLGSLCAQRPERWLGLYLGTSIAILLLASYFADKSCRISLQYLGESGVGSYCSVGVIGTFNFGFLLSASFFPEFVLAPLAVGIALTVLHLSGVRGKPRLRSSSVQGYIHALSVLAVVISVLLIVGELMSLISDKEYLDKQCIVNQMDNYCLNGMASVNLGHVILPIAIALSIVTLVSSWLYYRVLSFQIASDKSYRAETR